MKKGEDRARVKREEEVRDKAKVSVKCLIKGWRLGDDCFRIKDLQRQDNK